MPKQPSKKSQINSSKSYESFTLAIVVKDKKSNTALPNHFVEAWFHHTDRADELLGKARTNSDGYCAITFQWDVAIKNPQISPVYCKILRGSELLYNSLEDSKSWWLVMNHVDILLYAPEQGSVPPVLGIPLSTAHLNTTLNDLSTFSEAERPYILSKLEQALKSRVLETLNVRADDKAKEVIAPIRVDIAAVKDQSFNQLVQTIFLPALKADCKTSDLFKEIPVQEKPAQDSRTVKEVLQLDLKLGEHPVFNADVRKLKIHVLAKTAAISPETAIKLAGNPIPLETASEQDWQKLIEVGTITTTQKTALQYNFKLGKITGNNFTLVDKIYQDKRIKDAKDLTRWDAADWKSALDSSGGKTPNGESADDYVKTMLRVVQRNFPSAFFIERKVQRSLPTNTILSEFKKLEKSNSNNKQKAVITVPPSRDEAASIKGIDFSKSPVLKSTANTYKHLGIPEVFADSTKTPQEKVVALNTRKSYLQTFANSNPKLNLHTTNLFQKDAQGKSDFDFGTIPPEEQNNVLKQFSAYQRVTRLANTFEAQEILLAEGLDSSASIVNTAPKSLRQTLGSQLEAASFNQVVATAHAQFNVGVHTTAAIRGINTSRFVGFSVENYPQELINQLQDIEGYSEMFGSQDYCECDHCKSIFSPAAYFVDLMRFIEDNVHFWQLTTGMPTTYLSDSDSQPISLKARRPDLPNLELSCENTNSVLPYLQIVNEIKESYIQHVMSGIRNLPLNNTDVWKELSLLPLSNSSGHRIGAVGTTWKNGFRTAFNRPYEESQILLEAMGLRYADVLQALNITDLGRLEAAYLGASFEEYQTLITPDTHFGDLRDLRFGFPKEVTGVFALSACPVAPFLRATRLSREEMDFLLSPASQLRTISAAVRLVRTPVPNDVQNFTETIVGLNNATVLDFIHRMLRLKHLLPWTIQELNLVIQSVGGLTHGSIAEIARMREVQRILDISVEESIALCQEIPNTSIYTRRIYNAFLNLSVDEPVVGMLDRLFDKSKITIPTGSMSPNTLITNGQLPYLLKGLGASEADFRQIFKTVFGDVGTTILSVDNISKAYQVVRLAKILKLSVEEFLILLKLSGGYVLNSERILSLKQTVERLAKMPLSLKDIAFISTDTAVDLDLDENIKKSVEAWLTKWLADPRHYISVADLQKYLPPLYRESHIGVFISMLEVNNILILLPESDLGCRIVKLSPVQLGDIIDIFSVLTTDPDELASISSERQRLVDDLNDIFINSTFRQKSIYEQLGLQFKTDGTRVQAMAAWYDGFSAAYNSILAFLSHGDSAFDAVSLTDLIDLFKNFDRIALLFNKLKLDTDDVEWLNASIGDFITGANDALTNIDTLDEFLRLAGYKRFKDKAGDAEGITKFRTALLQSKLPLTLPDTWFSTYAPILSKVLACEEGQLKALEAVELASATTIKTIDDLTHLERLVQLAIPLSIWNATTLNAFKENNYTNALIYEKSLRSAFHAKYLDADSYEKAYEPIEERINELRRDVLCAFLLALDQQNKFHDTGDLYAYFLVDVEMSGCAKVSRILAATLTLQTYLHRVLMGLEITGDTPQIQAFLGKGQTEDEQTEKIAQWEWLKNYRVWEANRKVFLYPENWIEPELRDDKSPLFKTLEDELLQQKISLESAEEAYKEYLKGYLEISSLLIAGSYYDKDSKCYHLFGRTKNDPYQFHYRKFYPDLKHWSAWIKVELAIGSPYVGPVIHRNQMYLFWVDVVSLEKTRFKGGNSEFNVYAHEIILNYSMLNTNGKWLQPQKIKMGQEPFNRYWAFNDFMVPEPGIQDDDMRKEFSRDYYFSTKTFKKIYPQIINGKIHILYERESIQRHWSNEYYYLYKAGLSYSLNTFSNTLKEEWVNQPTTNEYIWTIFPAQSNTGWLYFQPQPPDINKLLNDADIDIIADSEAKDWDLKTTTAALAANDPRKQILRSMISQRHTFIASHVSLFSITGFGSKELLTNDKKPKLHVVHSSKIEGLKNGSDYIFEYDNQTYFIHRLPFSDGIMSKALTKISTSVTDSIINRFTLGLDEFLQPETQKLSETSFSLSFDNATILIKTPESTDKLNFSGAHGLYFRELFFHIPFLIADHLNAEGKYKEADYWYRKIFDPSGKVEVGMTESKDRYLQYIEFRNQTIPKLLAILTDAAAISVYENDPFNPHAIARLRLSAYMKSIVMKYVDNLIDWGDSLFRRDTWEANSEALMLYMLASDILGERPQKLGKCSSAIETNNCGCANPVTYSRLMETANLPPFIYYVENLVPISHTLVGSNNTVSDNGLTGSVVIGYEDISQNTVNNNIGTRDLTGTQEALIIPDSFVSQLGQQVYLRSEKQLVFCIPNNEKMLTYWDTVEDRLFKLRHCMNIDGVKRSLDLFAPPIDPALLVMARANGLSLDDILGSLYAPTPAYRFTYLVEKARAFAGTVQGFGGALLSALEKKDSEELMVLRSTHEQNLLKMTKEIKKKAIEEAKANLQSTIEGMVNTMNRMMQYAAWIEENLNGWERTQQISLHTSSTLSAIEPIYNTIASIVALIPNVGAPTAMTFGGEQLVGASANGARIIRSLAQLASIISSSAGLEASFKRREQDWEFQKKTAEQEIKQVQQQIAAATIRLAIAEKDLEIHEKQIEQAEEVHDFYKNKFTGLGLYNYMANTLSKLHRMAYNAAVDMANQAEAAFSFETDKNDFKGKLGTWDASRAGLLAGEDLSLQLQSMEAAYLKWHVRQMEIRQSFSMLMIDPEVLQALRSTGKCTFKIPEWAFDLQYPGHYHRRIVSLGITLPCIVGPYTNVAATLTMTKGSLRTTASVSPPSANGYTYKGSSMVATSSANNDGGQFELNFRDERFLPFEGAGAVDSEWVLELPTAFKSFDYNTISDVLFHLSYRSKYDGGTFKTNIETGLAAKAGNLKRLIILKEEFPDAWYELTKPTPATSVEIKLTAQHFPYFTKNSGIIKNVKIGEIQQTTSNLNLLNATVTILSSNMGDGNLLVTYSI